MFIHPSIQPLNLQTSKLFKLLYLELHKNKLDEIGVTCPALFMLWAEMLPQILQLVEADQAFDFHLLDKKKVKEIYTNSNIFVYIGGQKSFLNTLDALLLPLVHHLGTIYTTKLCRISHK